MADVMFIIRLLRRLLRRAILVVHVLEPGHERGRILLPAGATEERVEAARAEGLEVHADVYPYTASQTTLNMRLPDWTHEGGGRALAERLRDTTPAARVEVERSLSR